MGYPSVLMGSIQDDIHTAALNSISCVSQAALIGSGLSKGYEILRLNIVMYIKCAP